MSYTTSSLKFNINNKSLFSTLISLLFFYYLHQNSKQDMDLNQFSNLFNKNKICKIAKHNMEHKNI